MNEEGHWITINGTHVFVKEGQNPMDAFIRQKVNPKEKAEKLTELEYQSLCDELEENLTDEEKEKIESYGIGGGVSYYLNNPTSRDFERTYRFLDPNNPKGYVERKMSYLDALNTELDKKGSKFKTGDSNWDENIE